MNARTWLLTALVVVRAGVPSRAGTFESSNPRR
jgi:hypothetical protein